jgi:hypothetical protein
MISAPRKPDRTAADYLVIALSPALIMVLVGSLAWFLAEVGYRGQHSIGLRWLLAWFILGSTLITRIAIEVGSERAFVLGFGLAGAITLRLIQTVDPPFVGIGLLGLIWWCTHRLVVDCTLIDDDTDASGEGLLDAAGLRQEPKPAEPEARTAAPLVFVEHATAAARAASQRKLKKQKPHTPSAPGRWVIYFSLGVLPVFALGLAVLDRQDRPSIEFAFLMVMAYVAAALGLLLSTSFLGLRRYLRQRWLEMPGSMAAGWMARGAAWAVAVLAAALLLPRPQSSFSLTAAAARMTGREIKAEGGLLKDKPSEKAADKAPKESDPTQPRPENDQPPKGTAPKAADPGGSKSPKTSAATGTQSRPPIDLGKMTEILIRTVFLIFAAILFWRYRLVLWSGLVDLWRSLVAWWAGLGESVRPRKVRAPAAVFVEPTRPFAQFRDPFVQQPALGRDELLRYTFDGLEAWAAQHGIGRHPEETPLEFGRRLATQHPNSAADMAAVSEAYARLAYAQLGPDEGLDPVQRRLWVLMQSTTLKAA